MSTMSYAQCEQIHNEALSAADQAAQDKLNELGFLAGSHGYVFSPLHSHSAGSSKKQVSLTVRATVVVTLCLMLAVTGVHNPCMLKKPVQKPMLKSYGTTVLSDILSQGWINDNNASHRPSQRAS